VVVGFNDSFGFNGSTGTGSLSGYALSTDGGATFTDEGQIAPPAGGAVEGDPAVVVDRAGNFYYGQITADSTGKEFNGVARSTDGGHTFGVPVAATPKVKPSAFTGVPFQDKGYLAVGPNPSDAAQDIIYATWTNFASLSTVNIQEAHSTDGGATWSAPVTIASSSTGVQGSNPVVDPRNGKLYVFWENFLGTTQEIRVAASTDGGTTFGPSVRVGPAPTSALTVSGCGRPAYHFATGRDVRSNEFPSAAVDPATGNVFVTWDGGTTTSAGLISQIGAAASADGGRTWSATIVGGKQTTQRFQPWVTVDAGGVHVSYYQQQGVGQNVLAYAVSTSPATVPLAFGSRSLLSDRTFAVDQTDPNFDPLIATCYMGDYTNSTSLGNGKVFYVWGDNRNITSTGPNPDIFGVTQ
jgi:hypothetical protein